MLTRVSAFVGCLMLSVAGGGAAEHSSIGVDFDKQVQPVLSRYCYGCHNDQKHKGGLSLEAFRDKAAILQQPKTWELVMHHVQNKEMPPEGKPQPSEAERRLLVSWIEKEVFQCDCEHPNPGRVTVHRLNRTEYNNTIRDLVGVDFHPADDFPPDDSGYGFDNIGDALSLSPILLEKYFRASQQILQAAIIDTPNTNGPVRRLEAEKFEKTNAQARNQRGGYMGMYREVEIFTNIVVAKEGEYLLRTKAYGEQAGPDLPKMEVLVDGKSLTIFNVKAVQDEPANHEIKTHLEAGKHKISVAYLNNYNNPNDPPEHHDRNLFVDFVEVVGPSGPQVYPESHTRIFPRSLETVKNKSTYARDIIKRFAEQAYRRPVRDEEVEKLVGFYEMGMKGGEKFENSVRLALQAVLVSPNFLFRGERAGETAKLDDFALASRLSYFLWSSMPDEELFAEARKRTLRKHVVSQVRRMLRDPKATALVENFSGQWLQLRQLSQAAPDVMEFPQFDEELREAMEKETELFFAAILNENRSVLDFLRADFTFLNDRLAQHYGISGVEGDNFRRVSLKGTKRAGLLTHASVLTLTSNPNRTSPVKRGKWILENLLGSPPPPPPPDIPPLNDRKDAGQKLSLRQRLEEHRKNPSCASCHARMDPIGFALENFDAVGKWRTVDGKFAIDASGEFPTGETINGARELRSFLLEKRREEFVRCFAEKMLIYALGRGLEVYDRCAIDEIIKKAGKDDFRFSSLIISITESVPFQQRGGDDPMVSRD